MFIAILACHHRARHLTACRETWIKDIPKGVEYRFFFGRGEHTTPYPDEVILDCDDAYRGLACKVQSACKWALTNASQHPGIFKADDDTYIRPERLLAAGFEKHDYVGRLLGPTDHYHLTRYARGGTGYYMSRRVMEVLAAAPVPNPDNMADYAEDSWVGRITLESGFECINDDRLRCADLSGPNRTVRPNGFTGWRKDAPNRSNDFITTCEFLGDEMRPVHKEWLTSADKHSVLMGRLRIH